MWEFDCNCNVFKESCIESIPDYSMSFVATSQDNYLIVAPDTLHFYSYDHDCAICVHIFDGTSWIILRYDPILLGSNEKCISIIGNHIIYEVKFRQEFDDEETVTCIHKAPLLLGECEDSLSSTILKWERMHVKEISDTYICGYRGQRSLLLVNNQLFLATSQGMILTTFIQPAIGAIWKFVDSDISFRQAPHIVGLPNGELLMVGVVVQDDNCKSQLDIIKIHCKGMMIIIVL